MFVFIYRCLFFVFLNTFYFLFCCFLLFLNLFKKTRLETQRQRNLRGWRQGERNHLHKYCSYGCAYWVRSNNFIWEAEGGWYEQKIRGCTGTGTLFYSYSSLKPLSPSTLQRGHDAAKLFGLSATRQHSTFSFQQCFGVWRGWAWGASDRYCVDRGSGLSFGGRRFGDERAAATFEGANNA